MMSLKMKYFVLKPKSKFQGDPWAKASRDAMAAFSFSIRGTDPELAEELLQWLMAEDKRDRNLKQKENE